MFDNLEVTISPDAKGYLGRQCPDKACRKYFKILLSSWPPGAGEATCPYCGHAERFDKYITEDQEAYGYSSVMKKFAEEASEFMKQMEAPEHRGEGIGHSIDAESEEYKIKHYIERDDLDRNFICDECGLRYMVYGTVGRCPSCSAHNI